MATKVSAPLQHVTALGPQMNGASRVSQTTHHTSSKMSSSMCHNSQVIKTFTVAKDPSNMSHSISQSYHSQTFQNGIDSGPQLINSQNGHHVSTASLGMESSCQSVGDSNGFYDVPCSGGSPQIIRPIVTKATSSGQQCDYYGGSLEDRLSDYEDVWTTQTANVTFRPIQTARSVQELVAKSNDLDSEREHPGSRFSAVNPGYITDSCSEKDLTDSRLYHSNGRPVSTTRTQYHPHTLTPQQQRRQATTTTTSSSASATTTNFPHRHPMTARKSEIHRNEVLIGLKERQPDPVMFTFDLKHPQPGFRAGSEPREPPSRQPPTPPVRRHRLERSHHHRQQYVSPSYSEPFDSLVGRFNVAQKVTNSLRTSANNDNPEDEEENHSIKLEPIASPRLLERRPHQNTTQVKKTFLLRSCMP